MPSTPNPMKPLSHDRTNKDRNQTMTKMCELCKQKSYHETMQTYHHFHLCSRCAKWLESIPCGPARKAIVNSLISIFHKSI